MVVSIDEGNLCGPTLQDFQRLTDAQTERFTKLCASGTADAVGMFTQLSVVARNLSKQVAKLNQEKAELMRKLRLSMDLEGGDVDPQFAAPDHSRSEPMAKAPISGQDTATAMQPFDSEDEEVEIIRELPGVPVLDQVEVDAPGSDKPFHGLVPLPPPSPGHNSGAARAAPSQAAPIVHTPSSSKSVAKAEPGGQVRTSLSSEQNGPRLTAFSFELYPVWFKNDDIGKKRNPKGSRMSGLGKMVFSHSRADLRTLQSGIADEATDEEAVEGHMKRFEAILSLFIIRPSASVRMAWDLISLILVLFDMVMIPMQLLDPPDNAFFEAMSWGTRGFWSADILVSFMSGYTKDDGNIEMRPLKIVRHYMRTWLIIDLLVVGADWMEVFWSSGGGLSLARVGKASRTLRILRMLRLVRFVRLMQIVNILQEHIRSEKVVLLADILKIVSVLLFLSHILACVWYGVGNSQPVSWVIENNMRQKSVSYRYLTALHWSLSQFTGGMDEVTPESLEERIYIVFVFLLCFVISSVFLSNLTSSMTRLHILTSGQSQLLSQLRRFLGQNSISSRLMLRIQRNAQLAVMSETILEKDVQLLHLVSDGLRQDLHFEMFATSLDQHPFFFRYREECPQAVRRVCHLCVSELHSTAGEVIFNMGESVEHPKMYIVTEGFLEYHKNDETQHLVSERSWLVEMCLWVPWMHTGNLKAGTSCVLLQIDATDFQSTVSRFRHPLFDPRDYAYAFLHVLNVMESVDDLTQVPLTDAVKESLDWGFRKRQFGSQDGHRHSIGQFF